VPCATTNAVTPFPPADRGKNRAVDEFIWISAHWFQRYQCGKPYSSPTGSPQRELNFGGRRLTCILMLGPDQSAVHAAVGPAWGLSSMAASHRRQSAGHGHFLLYCPSQTAEEHRRHDLERAASAANRPHNHSVTHLLACTRYASHETPAGLPMRTRFCPGSSHAGAMAHLHCD
jgi:hypothetical protein